MYDYRNKKEHIYVTGKKYLLTFVQPDGDQQDFVATTSTLDQPSFVGVAFSSAAGVCFGHKPYITIVVRVVKCNLIKLVQLRYTCWWKGS